MFKEKGIQQCEKAPPMRLGITTPPAPLELKITIHDLKKQRFFFLRWSICSSLYKGSPKKLDPITGHNSFREKT